MPKFSDELNFEVELDEIERNPILEQEDQESKVRAALAQLLDDMREMAGEVLDDPEHILDFAFKGQLPKETEAPQDMLESATSHSLLRPHLLIEADEEAIDGTALTLYRAVDTEHQWTGGKKPGHAYDGKSLEDNGQFRHLLKEIFYKLGIPNDYIKSYSQLWSPRSWKDVHLLAVKPEKQSVRLVFVPENDQIWAELAPKLMKRRSVEAVPQSVRRLHRKYITINANRPNIVHDMRKLYSALTGRIDIEPRGELSTAKKDIRDYVDELIGAGEGPDVNERAERALIRMWQKLYQSDIIESVETALYKVLLEDAEPPQNEDGWRYAFQYFIHQYPEVWQNWDNEKAKQTISDRLNINLNVDVEEEPEEEEETDTFERVAPDAAEAIKNAGIDPSIIPEAYRDNKDTPGFGDLVSALGSGIRNFFRPIRGGRNMAISFILRALRQKDLLDKFKESVKEEKRINRDTVKEIFYQSWGKWINNFAEDLAEKLSSTKGVAGRPSAYAIIATPPDERGFKKIVYVRKRFKNGREELGLPGGGTQGQEDPQETIEREVKEETGLNIKGLSRGGIYGPQRNVIAYQLEDWPKLRRTDKAKEEDIIDVGVATLQGLLQSRSPRMHRLHHLALQDFYNQVKERGRIPKAKEAEESETEETETKSRKVRASRSSKEPGTRTATMRPVGSMGLEANPELAELETKLGLADSMIRQIANTISEDSDFTLRDLEALKKALVEELSAIDARLVSRLTIMPGTADYERNKLILSDLEIDIPDPSKLLSKLERLAGDDQDVILNARQDVDRYPEYYALLAIQPEMERRMLDSGYDYKGMSKQQNKDDVVIVLSPMSAETYGQMRQEMPLEPEEDEFPLGDLGDLGLEGEEEEELPSEEMLLGPEEEDGGKEDLGDLSGALMDPDEELDKLM